jgi:hypothetical protein
VVECLENQNDAREHVVQVEESFDGEIIVEFHHEQGEIMFKRVLLKLEEKVVEEPTQSKNLFKTKCKIQSKCCNLIIDGGNTANLVST